MEDTQAIDWAAEEEEETEQSGESLGYSLEPVGRLRVFGSTYGPEKDFPLYLGKNVVGRMPDCSVALPFPSISKQHAVIEISAWDKAPVLQDCGSLNGTQILRPPMVLRPGVSHRLRDHELILFADLPCQYRHLEEPMPMPSRGPLSVEETPRIPGDAHASRLPLAEDSDEEEADFLSERCMEKESRITSSPLTTVVPESDDEGPSALGGSGPSSAFNLDSDTDEDEAGKASAVRNSATTKAEQPRGDRITRDPRLVKALPAVKRDRDTEARKDAENRVALERSNPPGEDSDTDVDEDSRPAELHLERAQPSGFEDSDTDVEEEGVPETPAAILGKKRLILGAASTGGPGAHGMAHPQESPAGSDTDVEEQKCPAAGSQDSLVINSDTDDEEEVSAALTLARLKEGRAALWNRGMGTERTRTQPEVPLEQNQTSLDRDSNSALKKRHPVGRKETLPSAHRGKTEALGTAELGASRPPHGDSNAGGTAGKRSHGTHPESSQASSTTVHIKTEVEEGAPLGLAVAHLESRQAPVEGTNHTTKQLVQPLEARPFDKAYAEGDSASAVAAVRQIQRVAGGDAQEMAPEVGTPGRAPAVQGEQVVHTVTPGNPTLPQRGGARTPAGRKQKSYLTRTRSSKDSHDAGCEDLDLQATQCFVESESLEAIQGVEDEPTQAFLCMFSPEPGPSHCSSQAPDALDEPWEVLATQPFCVGESEHPEPRLTATCLQAPRSHLSPPRVAPQDQRPGTPAHVEPLGTEGRELQTVKRDRGTAREIAERVTPERGTSEREIKEQRAGESTEQLEEEKLARRIKDREPEMQVLAGTAQTPASHKKVDSMSPDKARGSLKEEAETPKDAYMCASNSLGETVERRALKGVAEKWVLDAECGVEAGLAVALERGESEQGYRDPKGQGPREGHDAPVSPEPGIGEGHQSGGAREAPVNPSGQPRGLEDGKMPPAESASRDAPLPAAAPQALVPHLGPFVSQSQKCSAPQPLLPPLPSSEPPVPGPGRAGRQEAPEPALSSELKTSRPKPSGRHRPRCRMTSAALPSAAHVLCLPAPIEQPSASAQTSPARTQRSSVRTPEAVVVTALNLQPSTSADRPVVPKPMSRATRGRVNKSSLQMPEAAEPAAPEPQPATSAGQPITPKPASRATRGRTNKSFVQTPEALVHTATSTHQPDTPEPAPQAPRGRANRSSIQTPKPVVPMASKLQPDTPEPISWATQGRTRKSSVKSPKLVLPTSSEQQLPTSTDRPITPKPTPRATRDRTSRTSVRTPEAAEPAAPKLQPSSSADRPVTPKPTRWALRGRTGKAPIEITEPAELSARDPEPPTATGQPVNPESVAHGGAAPESWPPVTTDQHVPWKPSPHTGRGQRQKTAGKRGSGSAATNHQPRSEPSFGDQRAGRRRAAASLKAIPGPSFSQPPEAPIQAPQVPKVEAADSFGSTQEPQPAASQQRKRPSPGTDPAPLLKRPQREGSHKTVVPKEEEEEVALEKPEKAEDVVTPEPGKRKRSHTEEEPQEAPKRGLRRTKSTQPSAAPKVLFTGVLDARGEQAVLALGGSLASSVAEASHLVTDRVRRTVKFLCALGKGIPVLSLEWLHQSRKAGHFLPPDQYVVTDPEQERNFGFSLQDALSRARERRLLEGYEIYVTPGVQPPPLQMGEIISCCGGTILPSMPRSYKPQRVVITCPQDLPRCSLASRAGLPLLSAEFLLTGVLKQEVRPEAFVLSSQEPAST
ncbi:mediator of DNA damage checkpoint protein 1 isoform X1 [Cavia porcellus]|uniref:mediator of DNA damage checkpoint protein 1 isoform X1 n=1 Tax=Cavia porcellus TaxID=10141 RepID=UPI002FE3D273